MKKFKNSKYIFIFIIINSLASAQANSNINLFSKFNITKTALKIGSMFGSPNITDLWNGTKNEANNFWEKLKIKNMENSQKNNEKKIESMEDKIKINSEEIVANNNFLEEQEEYIVDNTREIKNSNNKLDNLNKKVNKGLALISAMSAIEFQNLEVGNIGIGLGVSHYINSQGIAVGVGYAPTDTFIINAKYSMTTENINSSAIGLGLAYRFSL